MEDDIEYAKSICSLQSTYPTVFYFGSLFSVSKAQNGWIFYNGYTQRYHEHIIPFGGLRATLPVVFKEYKQILMREKIKGTIRIKALMNEVEHLINDTDKLIKIIASIQ